MSTRRRTPPIWLLALIVPLLGAIAWLQFSDATGDAGMNNVFSYLAALLAGGLSLLWFALFSGFGTGIRLGVLGLITALVVTLAVLFRVEGWSGSMLPYVSYRFAAPESPLRTELETRLPEPEAAVVLTGVRPEDFPGYYGPNRDGHAVARPLARDWEAQPPEELWRVPVGSAWSGFAVASELAVTLEQRDGEQVLVARHAELGSELWTYAWPGEYDHALGGAGPRSTPFIDASIPGGRVYAMGPRGQLVCVGARDGSLVWDVDLLQHLQITTADDDTNIGYGRSNSPLLVGTHVVVAAGGNEGRQAGLIAFDRDTGEVAWEGPPFQVSHASPAFFTLLDTPQIVVVNENTLSGHEPVTGNLLWQHPWPGNTPADANNSQPLVVGTDSVMVSKGYGQGSSLVRLSQTDGVWNTETVWAVRRSLRTKLTSAVIHDGHGYALSDGILECISLQNGKRVWKQGRYGHGQILLAGDLLLVLGEEGALILVEASPSGGGDPLARLDVLEGQTWNNLALTGDRLFVRNSKEAVALRLPTLE